MTTTSPTQGEHAQTEALRLADALYDGSYLLSVERYTTADELRRLHAQVTELTAALGVQADPVKDEATCQMCGEKPYPGCNSEFQDEAACLFYHPATAQPAAPQGVAYAELTDKGLTPELTAALQRGADGVFDLLKDWHLINKDAKAGRRLWQIGRNLEGIFGCALRGDYTRASNGQAPAGAASDDFSSTTDEDLMVIAVLGLNSARTRLAKGDCAGALEVVNSARDACIEAGKRASNATPTAQAAPAAGAVAVPRETLVAWRQWCAQSMSHAIEHEISDWLAAAPTPAAQADSQPAPVLGATNGGVHLDAAAEGDVMCGLQAAANALEAIAKRSRLDGDVIEPVDDIRKASRIAAEGYRRIGIAMAILDRAARAQADSVLEDAALLHYALADGGNHSMNWQDVYDDWNGEGYFIDALRAAYKQDAARKQGGA